MAHFLIDKRPDEVIRYDVDFSELLSDSDTILDVAKTTAALKVFNSAGEDKTHFIIQSLIFVVKTVTLVIQNGLNGEDYNIYVKGIGDVGFNTTQPVRVVELRVRLTLCGNV